MLADNCGTTSNRIAAVLRCRRADRADSAMCPYNSPGAFISLVGQTTVAVMAVELNAVESVMYSVLPHLPSEYEVFVVDNPNSQYR